MKIFCEFFSAAIVSRDYAYASAPSQEKKPLFPYGNKDRNNIFCGTTLFAVVKRPLCPVPTHRLPVNAGNASEDTEGTSSFSLPSAAHLLLRFSLPSQLWGTLCGCACSFTSASLVSFLSYAY